MIFYNTSHCKLGNVVEKNMKTTIHYRMMKDVVLVALLLNITVLSQAQTENSKYMKTMENTSQVSSTSKNKEVIKRLYEESLNKRNMKLLRELVSETYTGPQGEKGPEGLEATVSPLVKAFPDIQWEIEDLMGEGEKVVVRWTWRGTQRAPFRNLDSTGKTITNTAIAIYTMKNGKIERSSIMTDRLGFLQSLDALPADVNLITNRKGSKNQVNFIDRFLVPAAAKEKFYERMNTNRQLIKKLPGFIDDVVYTSDDEHGNLICVTVASWESQEALQNAKNVVQQEYQKQGFDLKEMMKQLNISVDRGVFTEVSNH
jgi:steroid delta-isomerase-like uncharacterized protein